MHFSKAYAQLLATLPPELSNNPFEYRKLKQLINQTVTELDSLGLGPSVLQELASLERQDETPPATVNPDASCRHTTITYEIALDSTVPEPRLRLSSGYPCGVGTPCSPIDFSATQPIYHVDLLIPEHLLSRITTALLCPFPTIGDEATLRGNRDYGGDMVIPLPSDTAFFQLLTSTLSSLSGHFDSLLNDFTSALRSLATTISLTALPTSSSAPDSFSAYSRTANNAMTLIPHQGGKSDLYTWREIFSLYAEAQIFESISESKQGERSAEEIEELLKLFEERVREKSASLALPTSADALDAFLNLNVFILDVRKLQLANSEATRKILKKHTKRTTLPIPFYPLERDPSASAPFSRQLALVTHPSISLPRLLVQAIGEVLLPVVPHIDDYSCLICTYVVFKPIRLRCGHLFCVRCLVKLQRRGKANCPLCRAPTVLQANPSNLDYGLLNFIADWFPVESLEKLREDQRELTREQMEDLCIADVRGCRIM